MIATGPLDRVQATLDCGEPDGVRWATVRHTYVLRGERGAVHFVYGDWGPAATDDMRAIDTKFMTKFGHPLYPMAFDVGYHTPAPMNVLQVENGPAEHCEWIDGPCYGDGSAIRARMVFDAWQHADRDDEVIWSRLHEYYLGRFHADEIPTVGEALEDMDFGETLSIFLNMLADPQDEEQR